MNKSINIKIIIVSCVVILSVVMIFILFVERKKLLPNDYLAGNTNYEKVSYYNNPIIPKGFKKVETEGASWELIDGIPQGWNDGLVIEDEIGNQFIWIPVNLNNIEFSERDLKYNYAYNKNKMNMNDREEAQILRYGGFYIARYEAGLPEKIVAETIEFNKETNNVEGTPTSKKNQIVWNYIDWSLAKKNSTKMYYNDDIESDLVTTKQWNYIMYWLEQKGYDTEDSKEWGNYSNNNFEFTGYYSRDYGKTYKHGENINKQRYNMILSTGATERNKSANIYDIAGNISEFVDIHSRTENNGQNTELYCSWGGYYDNISKYSANSNMAITTANSKQGFRVALYLK